MSGHYIEIKFTPQKTNQKKKPCVCVYINACNSHL